MRARLRPLVTIFLCLRHAHSNILPFGCCSLHVVLKSTVFCRRYDAEEGYYYSVGGGWITNGPARSRTLARGSWTVSPLAPMAVPDARAVAAGLPPSDQLVGFNTQIYTALWKGGVGPTDAAYGRNMSAWNYGATDPDLCCTDGKAPSYLLNTLSRQGTPTNISGGSWGFSRLRMANLTLNAWLRSYFP